MHSHIQIPNAVLQNFRDESDREKKVWYLDLSTGEIQKKPARRLGTAKNYYSGTGEAFWSQCIESPLGNLIKKVRSFCEGDSQAISITPNDKEIAIRYIKAAAVRSNLSYEVLRQASITADMFSEQNNHDALSFFGMTVTGEFDQIFENLSVTVLANRTDRHLVVPRNCYYCVSRQEIPNFIVPISSRSAFLLLPTEHLNEQDNGFALVDDPAQVEMLNIHALKYEYMFNGAFVASDCRVELEFLKRFREENIEALNALRNCV